MLAMLGSLLIRWALYITLFAYLGSAYKRLSNESLQSIPGPGDDFDIQTGKLLAPILRPRVPGSPGSTYVLNHFVDFFKTTLPKWQITFQNSTSKTPATGSKDIPFVNLIVSRDPPWSSPGSVGYLTLVAHYDSKLTPSGFIGATDSAVPCAILMHAARSVDAALTKKWAAMQMEHEGKEDYVELEDHMGIQIFFLDGEEAFKTWTHEDSLYGAKSLAAELEATPNPALSSYSTALSSISLFVLLDLLGARNPRVPSFYETTHWAYCSMATLEKRLRSLSLFSSMSSGSSKYAKHNQRSKTHKHKDVPQSQLFLPESDKQVSQFSRSMVEDDHLPFMARGTEVLHIIPIPFPKVWHHLDDDGEHLDLATCADWAVLVTAFVGEWMELDDYLGNHRNGKEPRLVRRQEDKLKTVSKTEL